MSRKRRRRHRGSVPGKAGTLPSIEGDAVIADLPAWTWLDEDGFHVVSPGGPLDQKTLDEMTRRYRENIRNSPVWDDLVKRFGQAEAEEILKQCRVEAR